MNAIDLGVLGVLALSAIFTTLMTGTSLYVSFITLPYWKTLPPNAFEGAEERPPAVQQLRKMQPVFEEVAAGTIGPSLADAV